MFPCFLTFNWSKQEGSKQAVPPLPRFPLLFSTSASTNAASSNVSQPLLPPVAPRDTSSAASPRAAGGRHQPQPRQSLSVSSNPAVIFNPDENLGDGPPGLQYGLNKSSTHISKNCVHLLIAFILAPQWSSCLSSPSCHVFSKRHDFYFFFFWRGGSKKLSFASWDSAGVPCPHPTSPNPSAHSLLQLPGADASADLLLLHQLPPLPKTHQHCQGE